MKRLFYVLLIIVALAAASIAGIYLAGSTPVLVGSMVMNYFRNEKNPPGTIALDLRQAATVAPVASNGDDLGGDWPNYNRSLSSERYSPLAAINTKNAAQLKVLCTYDTKIHGPFEVGPLVVDGALIGTTALDIFSIDAATCKENWRTSEKGKLNLLPVNRGAAYLDGRLFRGTLDGNLRAYDFKTGKRLWETNIVDPKTGGIVSSAPIAWNGLVFISAALGDYKGVRGRVYAIAADTGKIVWETYTVPKLPEDVARGPQGVMPADEMAKTWGNAPDVPISGGGSWTSYTLDPASGHLFVPVGNPSPDFAEAVRPGPNLFTNTVLELDAMTGAYVRHYPIMDADWHDWDVSNTPALVTTRGGKQLVAFAPKDGHLYGFDRADGKRLYRNPVTRIENADAKFSTTQTVHFCPGSVGGGEWNGVAFDPATNLLFTGQDEWCASVRLQAEAKVIAAKEGQSWMGQQAQGNPLNSMGSSDPYTSWAGWLYASDADTGAWAWRAKTNYPILSGVTPTAGGILMFGDMGGNFYVLDSANGKVLWNQKLDGAIGGGVITYMAGGVQRIAVAAGLTSPLWPTEITTGKIVVLGTN
jgi:Glucose dehydrogenase